MNKLLAIATVFLCLLNSNAGAEDLPAINDKPAVKNPLPAPESKLSTVPKPGDLFFKTSDGEYLNISDKNYGVIVKNVADATPFGRMEYKDKTYYIANSGANSGYYLSYAYNGYTGTYRWESAVAWKQDSSLCMTVDNGSGWKTSEYETGGIKYVLIGSYSYPNKCFLPVSATEPYQPIKLQPKYVNENASCSWQPAGQCAPYVVYFTESQSASLALSVSGGKLYQGSTLFDTSGADPSHSILHTSIFVMDMNGVVYASKQNKHYLLHHSSLLAGRDVAFAGEMEVVKGVITRVTNCSGHYMPNISYAKQLTESLQKQGYSVPVKVESCSPKYFDLNYNEINPVK